MKRRYLSVVLALAWVVALAPSALAETYSAPGLLCRINGQSEQPNMSSKGRAYNNSGVARWYLCPMNRSGSTVDTAVIDELFANVVDGHTGNSVKCHVRSCNATQSACVNSPVVTSADFEGNSFTGTAWLYFNQVGAYADGVAFLKCDVPVAQNGESGVSSYRWRD